MAQELKPRIRTRAVVLGLVLIPAIAGLNMSVETIRYAGQPSTIAVYPHVMFVLLCLLAVNALAGRLRTSWRLTPAELLTVYFMVFIGAALSSHDMMEVLVPVISYPFRYANPTNRWAEEVLPRLPAWLTVSNPDALQRYYSGHASLWASGDWHIWLQPALAWSGLLTSLAAGLFCLNVLLRRQWAERERLSYPLVQLTLELVQPRQSLWSSKPFWIAFAAVSLLDIWFGLSTLYPSLPPPYVRYQVLQTASFTPPWNALPFLTIAFYPFIVGLGMLLPTDLLFSAWFFRWIWSLQPVVAAYYGWDQIPGFPYVSWQGAGGYFAVGLLSLWSARQALGRGFAAIWRGAGDEDHGEALSYRWAALGFILMQGVGFVFLRACGLNPWASLLTLAIYALFAVSIARMRAEAGSPAHGPGPDVGPQHLVPLIAGTENLSKQDLVAFGLVSGFNRNYRGSPVPPHAEGLQAMARTGGTQRVIFWALVLAAGWGAFSGFLLNVHLNYHWGAAAMADPPYVSTIFGREPWDRVTQQFTAAISSTQRTNSLIALCVGMLTTLALGALRLRWTGCPLHPIGYAISFNWSLSLMWLSILVAWICKVTILRTGGLRLYRRVLPVFLGLTLGECFTGTIWYLISVATGTKTFILWPYG